MNEYILDFGLTESKFRDKHNERLYNNFASLDECVTDEQMAKDEAKYKAKHNPTEHDRVWHEIKIIILIIGTPIISGIVYGILTLNPINGILYAFFCIPVWAFFLPGFMFFAALVAPTPRNRDNEVRKTMATGALTTATLYNIKSIKETFKDNQKVDI